MAYNSKRRGGDHHKGYRGIKFMEANFRRTRHSTRDALKAAILNPDKDVILNKFSPRAISARLE